MGSIPIIIPILRELGPRSNKDARASPCGRPCAPDDVHQALAVRLSFPNQGPEERHDDTLFPRGQQREFLAALRGQTTDERLAFEPHMDEISLQKLAAANPIASVLKFAHLTESFRTDLLGHSSDRSSNLSMLVPPPSSCGVSDVGQQLGRHATSVCLTMLMHRSARVTLLDVSVERANAEHAPHALLLALGDAVMVRVRHKHREVARPLR